jgi:hypothetical protein
VTIVTYSVCDQCGTQKEIINNTSCGISITFSVTTLGGKTEWKNHVKTFCDADCLIEYFRSHIVSEGFVETVEEKNI